MHFSDWGNMGGTTESGGGAGNIFILIWGIGGGECDFCWGGWRRVSNAGGSRTCLVPLPMTQMISATWKNA